MDRIIERFLTVRGEAVTCACEYALRLVFCCCCISRLCSYCVVCCWLTYKLSGDTFVRPNKLYFSSLALHSYSYSIHNISIRYAYAYVYTYIHSKYTSTGGVSLSIVFRIIYVRVY